MCRRIGATAVGEVRVDLEKLLGHRIHRRANLFFRMHGSDKKPKSRGLFFDGRVENWLDVDSSIVEASRQRQ